MNLVACMGVHKSACDPWAQTWASHQARRKMKAAPDGARNTIRGLANPSGTKVPPPQERKHRKRMTREQMNDLIAGRWNGA